MSSVEAVNSMYSNGPVHAGGMTAASKPRPRITTTLWEDENTLCFQVEARGISVARREDNDMINGTKLLNVAGMTRGRRDGMLKAEKVRHVVKIGAMHLKGVWIPFDRAAAFAQKEGIADLLYPLFVEDIRSFLYRQQNNSMPDASMLGSTGTVPSANKGYAAPTAQHPQYQQMAAANSQSGLQRPLSGPRDSYLASGVSAAGGMGGMGPGAMGALGGPEKRDDGSGAGHGLSLGGAGAGGAGNPTSASAVAPDGQNGQQAYNRQYGYMPQYGVQGYGAAPMGSNYGYSNAYGSYPQMMYGNQDYMQPQAQQAQQQQAQQPMYYHGYQQQAQQQQQQQPYDQSQVYQQTPQQPQHAQQAQPQAQPQAQYYMQQHKSATSPDKKD